MACKSFNVQSQEQEQTWALAIVDYFDKTKQNKNGKQKSREGFATSYAMWIKPIRSRWIESTSTYFWKFESKLT